jgi:hypothetical protein
MKKVNAWDNVKLDVGTSTQLWSASTKMAIASAHRHKNEES